jgi:hypothetical protein
MTDFTVERSQVRNGRTRSRSFKIRDEFGRVCWEGHGFSPPTLDGDYRERAIDIALTALRRQPPPKPDRDKLRPDLYAIVEQWREETLGERAA